MTRTLVLGRTGAAPPLDEGPRAVSVAAIAQASGAPTGTLYHRFGSRDGILAAAWLRALERFAAAEERADARAVEAVTRAVVDLPAAAVRRHSGGGGPGLPPWLEEDLIASIRALLA